jgi:hypothetical protein
MGKEEAGYYANVGEVNKPPLREPMRLPDMVMRKTRHKISGRHTGSYCRSSELLAALSIILEYSDWIQRVRL